MFPTSIYGPLQRLSIFLKVPQIILFLIFAAISPSTMSGFAVVMVYPDAALTNILATKIYRNMKLRRSGILPITRTHGDATFATHQIMSLSPAQVDLPGDNHIGLSEINSRVRYELAPLSEFNAVGGSERT